jgi:hypothetical protein
MKTTITHRAVTISLMMWVLLISQIDKVIAQWVENDTEFLDALSRMNVQGMTRMQTVEAFRPYDRVTRQEAAKFFSEFSTSILLKVMDLKRYCEFTDLKKADATLRNAILTSCMVWLFRGSWGEFRPQQQLTKAEAIVVLIRALEWNLLENTTPWRNNYYQRAIVIWLLKQTPLETMEQSITRYEIALLLKRASQRIKRR